MAKELGISPQSLRRNKFGPSQPWKQPVKDWIRHNGGLTTDMKKIKNGTELWKIVDPCPEEF